MMGNAKWKGSEGADQQELAQLKSISSAQLPKSYLEFLANTNGGEGELRCQPCWLILYSAEEVAEIALSETYQDFFPGFFVIGSNGGGQAIAFAVEEENQERIVYFDTINVNLKESVVELAPTFEGLMSLLGRCED